MFNWKKITSLPTPFSPLSPSSLPSLQFIPCSPTVNLKKILLWFFTPTPPPHTHTSCGAYFGCFHISGFKAYHSALLNQEGAHLWNRFILLLLLSVSHSLLVVFCIVARLHDTFPFHINVSTDVSVLLVLFMWPFLGQTVSWLTSWYSGSCMVFFPLLCDVPWNMVHRNILFLIFKYVIIEFT